MDIKRVIQTIVATAVVSVCSAVVLAKTYRLTVAGERLEFVTQPEKGYVVKLAPDAGGIHALAGLSALDAEDASEIRGLGRCGVWTVENKGPASRNEEMIRTLRTGGRVAYAAPLFSSNGETVAIIPEIVVRVKPGVEMEEVERFSKAAGCTIRKRMEFTEREYLLEVVGPDAEAVFAAAEELGRAAEVEWACPNTAMRLKLCGQRPAAVSVPAEQPRIASAGEEAERTGVFPNDEYFPNQWHLYNTGQSGGTAGADIRAPEAWEITTGDPNIVIAVIGGGVDMHHPDLVNNLVPGYDFFEEDSMPEPGDSGGWEDAHETMCAGVIAAQGNNAIGLAGVAYNCKVMPIRVGNATTWIAGSKIATSFRWAATHGADVLSNSWSWSANPTPSLYSAIVDVTQPGGLGRGGKGCVVVFAAGNSPGLAMDYPNRYPEVIAVGATDHSDICWHYSTHGPELDLMAPSGCDGSWCGEMASFWSTDQMGPGGYSDRNSDTTLLDYGEYWGGTSVSCPIVAGVAALILSIEPNLTSGEVRDFMTRSAKDLGDPGKDDYYGWGRVDVRAALDLVLAKRCDLNGDWNVDDRDLAIVEAAIDTNDLSADIAPPARRDGVVDGSDFELVTRYLGTVIPLGLIAHWKLDETAGIIAHDSAGEHHDTTILGVPFWHPEGGKVGGALQLSGVPNSLITKFSRDPATCPVTVFAWVKGGGPDQVIISQRGGSDWLMASPAGGTLMTNLKLAGGQSQPLTSSAVITDGNWHRVGLSWDGSSRILSVDGVEVARDTQVGLASSTEDFTFGGGGTMAPSSFWQGLIDDVRIYDRAVKP